MIYFIIIFLILCQFFTPFKPICFDFRITTGPGLWFFYFYGRSLLGFYRDWHNPKWEIDFLYFKFNR